MCFGAIEETTDVDVVNRSRLIVTQRGNFTVLENPSTSFAHNCALCPIIYIGSPLERAVIRASMESRNYYSKQKWCRSPFCFKT